MENQNELTEDQIIELRGKVESYRLASIITAIIIGAIIAHPLISVGSRL